MNGLISIGVLGFSSAAIVTGVWLIRQLRLAQANPQLLNPQRRLQDWQEVQQAAQLGLTLDVNRASVDQWLRLPGLSIHQARLLVNLTQSGVQFHCLEDVAVALELPTTALQPLAPILQFAYYDSQALSTALATRVNVNAASIEQLLTVPGVSHDLATWIVAQRQRYPYRDLADLQQRLKPLQKEYPQLYAQANQRLSDWLHYLRF
ncbi:MAG: ComEA family DNA-binding protein [Cyanobacteria bacterium P01_H01_bin.121]